MFDLTIDSSHVAPISISFVWITIVTYIYNVKVLKWIENRSTLVEIYDPILEGLPTINTSVTVSCISVLNFASIFIGFDTYKITVYIWAMWWTILIRSISLFLCPLKVHPKHYILHDYFIETFAGHTKPYVNDLFFSGHMSNAFVITFIFQDYLLPVKLLLNVILAFNLLLCKTHYSIDIFIAPFIAYNTVHWSYHTVEYIFPFMLKIHP